MNKKKTKITVATGGTGGHIIPALALADHLNENKIIITITTDKRGLKYIKDQSKFKIKEINTSTIFNKNIFYSFFSLFIILNSVLKSIIFLTKEKPELIFGMGGYSSFPVCIAAKILRIPFIIYENNLILGKANKFLLPFAKKILVSNKQIEGIKDIHRQKISVIGNIIRKDILNYKKKLGFKNDIATLNILIIGGSQAAKIFAERLPNIFKVCSDNKIYLKIFQQCLPEQNNYLENFYKKIKIEFEIFNFKENIHEYFSKINLAITRSGSSILAELINARIPFISIPLPSSAENHQLKNAIYYEKNEYSYLIEEKNLEEKLFYLLSEIEKNRSMLDKIIDKQKQFSDKLVYENIDQEIKKVINEKY